MTFSSVRGLLYPVRLEPHGAYRELDAADRGLACDTSTAEKPLGVDRGDLEHTNVHRKALVQPSGQLMLITCVCLPLPAWFAMLVAGLLSSPSTHMPIKIKLEDVRSSHSQKNHMMHDGALTSAIFVLVAVDARAARWSQGGREGEDQGISHGRV